jgi:hypothetical protein
MKAAVEGSDTLHVKGEIPSDVLSYLEHTFGQDMEVLCGDNAE